MVAQDPLPQSLPWLLVKTPKVAFKTRFLCIQKQDSCVSLSDLLPPARGEPCCWSLLGDHSSSGQHCPLSWSHCSHKCSYRKSTLSFPLSLFTYNFSLCFSLRSHSICRPSGKFSHKVEKPWKGVGCRRHKPGARQGVSSEACRPGAWTFHLCEPSLVIGQGSDLCF